MGIRIDGVVRLVETVPNIKSAGPGWLFLVWIDLRARYGTVPVPNEPRQPY